VGDVRIGSRRSLSSSLTEARHVSRNAHNMPVGVALMTWIGGKGAAGDGCKRGRGSLIAMLSQNDHTNLIASWSGKVFDLACSSTSHFRRSVPVHSLALAQRGLLLPLSLFPRLGILVPTSSGACLFLVSSFCSSSFQKKSCPLQSVTGGTAKIVSCVGWRN
jgi:hypothetical protein